MFFIGRAFGAAMRRLYLFASIRRKNPLRAACNTLRQAQLIISALGIPNISRLWLTSAANPRKN
jgi:hypothetical protein